MKNTVEALIKDERNTALKKLPNDGSKDYTIKYVDGDNEQINVSDDEDLATAYDVAEKELKGNLKFIIEFKKMGT